MVLDGASEQTSGTIILAIDERSVRGRLPRSEWSTAAWGVVEARRTSRLEEARGKGGYWNPERTVHKGITGQH